MEWYIICQIDNDLLGAVNKKAKIIEDFIKENILPIDDRLTYRGVGMIWGIDFAGIDAALSKNIMTKCFLCRAEQSALSLFFF